MINTFDCMCAFVCSDPEPSEASQDFLKSCSADGVSCTAETEVSNSGGEEEGERDRGPHWTGWVAKCHYTQRFTIALLSHALSDEDNVERACDTLLMCIVTVLNHGLRNGGGVGDVLRKPSKNVNT